MIDRAMLLAACATLVAGVLLCAPTRSEPVMEETLESKIVRMMSDKEQLEYILENCICADCPSWTEECTRGGERGGYCVYGETECIERENGCRCADCPVARAFLLRAGGYYCTRGRAPELAELRTRP